jgi:hypothetical protein
VRDHFEQGGREMKKRPTMLWVIGLALVLSPIVYHLDAASKHGIPPGDLVRVWASIPLPKLIGIMAAPIVGTMVLWVRPISWYAVLAFAGYTTLLNVSTAAMGTGPAPSEVLFVLIGLACILFFVRREIRSPYFSPRLRWWEPNPRMPVVMRVDIKGHDALACSTYDVSSTGAFLTTESPVPVGERVQMGLHFGSRVIDVAGTVMWTSDGHKMPRGMGLRFDSPSPEIAGLMKGLKPREPRARAKLKVVFEGHPDAKAEAVNISTKGAFVATEETFEVDAAVAFTVEWRGTAIPVRGTVSWVSAEGQTRGVGVRFEECPAELAAAVRELRASAKRTSVRNQVAAPPS